MNSEIWYPNDGGDCPVAVGIRLDLQHRDGSFSRDVCACGPGAKPESYWFRHDKGTDIVAYRIRSESRSPGEWIVNGVKAPSWAIGIAKFEGTAWVGHAGYNYRTDESNCIEHRFDSERPRAAFIVTEWRPGCSPAAQPRIAAHEFLERGVKHMRDRAVQRDSDAGERSMARAVAAFNAQEGTNLTEAQGWRFMIQLKYARAVNGVFVADDYEDMAAYAGLAGEAAQ